MWDDRSLNARDFAVVCPLFTAATIKRLERQFLLALKYKVEVTQSLYAQYYFELRSLSSELTPESFPLAPLSAAEAKRLEVRSQIGKRLPSLAKLRSTAAPGSRAGSNGSGRGGGSHSRLSLGSSSAAASSASDALDLAVAPAVGSTLYTRSPAMSRFVLS